ncbi:unnamed protein product, partial [Allacma fusca]
KTAKEKQPDFPKNVVSTEQAAFGSGGGNIIPIVLRSIEREVVMEEARLCVLRIMKVSFWRQFEHGLLIEMALLNLVSAVAEAQAKPLKLVYTEDLRKYWNIESYSPGSPLTRVTQKLKKLVLKIPNMDDKLHAKLFSGYEIDQRTDARRELGILQRHHPGIGTAVKTRHASRLVLNHMRQTIAELKEDGLMDKDDWGRLVSEVNGKMKRLSKMSKSILPNTPEAILKNVPWIRASEETYDFFIEHAELLTFAFGDIMCNWKELSNGIYIIILGMVKIDTFCTGGYDFFYTGMVLGEKGVITGQRRAALVTCETIVQAYHISESIMQLGMTTFHSLEEQLWLAVGKRLAYAILSTHPKYSEWNTVRLHVYIERCGLLTDSRLDTMWIEESVAEVLIIQGKVSDILSGETFTAPQLVPRRVSKIMLVHTPKLKTRILVILSCKASTQSTSHRNTVMGSFTGPEVGYF